MLRKQRQEITVPGQSGQKFTTAYFKNKPEVVVISVVPATQEAEGGGSWFKVSPEKVSMRLCL
jgi:hypothetical protein